MPDREVLSMFEPGDAVREAIERGWSMARDREGHWTAYDGLGHHGIGPSPAVALARLELAREECAAGGGLCGARRGFWRHAWDRIKEAVMARTTDL